MRAVWLLSLVVGGLSPSASADTVFGVYAGAGSWLQDYRGEIASGITKLDVEDDLAIGEEQNNVFYLAIEHPIPVLPNVRFAYARFDAQDQSTLTRTVDFNGVIFPNGTDIETLVDMTQGDAVFYYELVDTVVSLDLGMAARYVEGETEIVSAGDESTAQFEAWLPMLYAKTRLNLPLRGLWIGGEALGVAYDDESMVDATAHFGWRSPFGVGIELGYRWYTLDLGEHGDLDSAQVDVSGPFAALDIHF